MDKKALEIRVTGRVQGVFFRRAARDRAEELGLAGFARNEPDGSVRLEIEGEAGALGRFLEWCRAGGSEQSWVRTMDHKEIPCAAREGFRIL